MECEQKTVGSILPLYEERLRQLCKHTGHYDKVQLFMLYAGQLDFFGPPAVPDYNTRLLRAQLILEEALETISALGFEVTASNSPADGSLVLVDGPNAKDGGPLEEIVDGCLDIAVVTTGTLVACNVPDTAFQAEVDDNNLLKFGPGYSFSSTGKLIKPPNHQPPKIKEMLCELTALIQMSPETARQLSRPQK